MNLWTWIGLGGIAACGAADAANLIPSIVAGLAGAACLWIVMSFYGRRNGGRHVR